MTIFLGWLFFCIAAAMFASIRRNRNAIGWFAVAFFFTPLVAFVLLAILKPLDPEPITVRVQVREEDTAWYPWVKDLKDPQKSSGGTDLVRRDQPPGNRKRVQPWEIIGGVAVCFLLICLINWLGQ